MQEYCTRGTRRDATKAILKFLSNHLSIRKRRKEKQRKRNAKQISTNPHKNSKRNQTQMTYNKIASGQRYLPHDPHIEREDLNVDATSDIEAATTTKKVAENIVDGKVNYLNRRQYRKFYMQHFIQRL